MARISVAGTTGWGVTLALVCARDGHDVTLWARTEAESEELASGHSPRPRPGVDLHPDIRVVGTPGEAFTSSDVVLFVVPSTTVRANVREIAPWLPPGAIVVSCTKGIEIETGKRMTELICEEAPGLDRARVGALSGPNLALEIAQGQVSSATLAFPSSEAATAAQSVLNSERFRVYRSTDVAGVELGGALKNIITIGAGIIDGMGVGNNAKSAFVTRGLHEVSRLGVTLGARQETFAGLSGMGDLIASCYSGLSRNRGLGEKLASGSNPGDLISGMTQTAEGVPTTRAAMRIARRRGVEMPITEMTHRVLFEGLSPQQALVELMRRAPQPEVRF